MSAPVPSEAVVEQASARTRFAQLIYTSYDDGSAGGGWRVKAETGELTPDERQALTSRIVTRFDVGEPLPSYPTAEQIARRPARLAYAPLTEDAAGYWHTVDAGNDGTGRPGNVMAHVVLDRSVRAPSSLRPIQVWGSPNWLRPFSAPEVAAATLTVADLPGPSEDTSVAEIVTFLTGTRVDRQSVFRVLLDAVYAAIAGGPGIMLITHDLRTGPRWIAALSYFMSPSTARLFSFSTHDDPSLAVSDLRRGTHFVVVSEDAAKKAAGEQWAVVDDAEEPGIGEVGSTHRTAKGDVAVTGWSVLAEGVLESDETAMRVLASQDAIAAEIGDHGLSPAWPLALAVRRDPALAEYHADADLIIADDQPHHASAVEWIAQTVAAAVARTAPDNADDALERLVRAERRNTGTLTAARQLLQTALVDPQWLSFGPVDSVPAAKIVVDDVHKLQPLVVAAVHSLRAHDSDGLERLRVSLRIADLLGRLCRPGPELDHALEPVHQQVAEDAASLAGIAPSSAMYGDPAIGVATRELVLRPAVARLAAPSLYSIDARAWAWLFGDATPTPVIPDNPRADDRVLMAHYIRAVLGGPLRPAPGQLVNQLAADAAFLALDAEGLGDEDCRALVNAISAVSVLHSADISRMFAGWPQRVSPRLACAPALYEPVPVELLTALAARPDAEHDTASDRIAVTAARLRVLRHIPPPWTDGELMQALTDAAAILGRHVSIEHIPMVDPDLVEVLGVAFVVGEIRGEPWADARSSEGRALSQRLAGHSAGMVDMLTELTRCDSVEVEWFVSQGLLQRIDGVLDTAPLVADSHAEGAVVFDGVVAKLVELNAYTGPTDVPGLRDSAWKYVRKLSAERAERFFDGYERAARDWLQDSRIGGDNGMRTYGPNV